MTIRKLKKREIGLVLILMMSVYFTVSLDSKTKRMKNANKKLRSSGETAGQTMPMLQTGMSRRTKKTIAGEAISVWGMDPFNRIFTRETEEESSGSDGSDVVSEDGNVKLHGIMITAGCGWALINGTICAEGDTLNGLLVERIEKDRVRLRRIYDSSTFNIIME